jgi:hypothetical protein
MNPLDYPVVISAITFVVLYSAAWVSGQLGDRRRRITEDIRPDFDLVLGAALTLLGLVIGFSFSMTIGRYEQRNEHQEAEATAIKTAYLRADLLPQEYAARVRELLRQYTDLRIQFFSTGNHEELRRIDADTTQIQNELWIAVSRPAAAQPTAVASLAVASINEVLNSEGFTREAWEDRIPTAAWGLMFGIALGCNILFGYGARRISWKLFIVLPLVVAVSFSFIADLNSPRGGFIRIRPQTLMSLRESLK